MASDEANGFKQPKALFHAYRSMVVLGLLTAMMTSCAHGERKALGGVLIGLGALTVLSPLTPSGVCTRRVRGCDVPDSEVIAATTGVGLGLLAAGAELQDAGGERPPANSRRQNPHIQQDPASPHGRSGELELVQAPEATHDWSGELDWAEERHQERGIDHPLAPIPSVRLWDCGRRETDAHQTPIPDHVGPIQLRHREHVGCDFGFTAPAPTSFGEPPAQRKVGCPKPSGLHDASAKAGPGETHPLYSWQRARVAALQRV